MHLLYEAVRSADRSYNELIRIMCIIVTDASNHPYRPNYYVLFYFLIISYLT